MIALSFAGRRFGAVTRFKTVGMDDNPHNISADITIQADELTRLSPEQILDVANGQQQAQVIVRERAPLDLQPGEPTPVRVLVRIFSAALWKDVMAE